LGWSAPGCACAEVDQWRKDCFFVIGAIGVLLFILTLAAQGLNPIAVPYPTELDGARKKRSPTPANDTLTGFRETFLFFFLGALSTSQDMHCGVPKSLSN
jgi:hypothetical protein